MTTAEGGSTGGSEEVQWRRPRVETPGLQRYVQVLRERMWVVVATLLATTVAAIGYLATAGKVYKADADLLVTPVTGDDPTLTGLPLLRESADPTRDVETAARLVSTRDVANRARRQLHLGDSPSSLLHKVKAEPVAQSNIVAVTASASSPKLARDLANAFSDGVVAERSSELSRSIDQRLPRLAERVKAGEGGSGPDSPAAELSQLTSLKESGDPTLRVETRAETPTSQ